MYIFYNRVDTMKTYSQDKNKNKPNKDNERYLKSILNELRLKKNVVIYKKDILKDVLNAVPTADYKEYDDYIVVTNY